MVVKAHELTVDGELVNPVLQWPAVARSALCQPHVFHTNSAARCFPTSCAHCAL